MFSVQQKREISDTVQKILRATNHPELPTTGEVSFTLHVDGAESWSFADIKNNASVGDPGVNPHNESMANIPEEEARGLIEDAQAHQRSQTPYMPDPRQAPDEFMRDMLTQTFKDLKQRIKGLEDRDEIHRKLYSELRFGLDNVQEFLTPIMEDNLIKHHDDQIRNMMTAMEGINDRIKKTIGDA